MSYQSVFSRYELKYLLNPAQKKQVLDAMQPHMKLDDYGRTTIRNIYYDTPSYRLVRQSLERPAYKEKLRIRSYCQADPFSPVYVELKKKYDGVVYKRRIGLPEKEAMAWISGSMPCLRDEQIVREIDYFRDFYTGLEPKVFLSYEREAYFALDGSDFRVTFDESILSRQRDLSLCSGVWGTPLLKPGQTLMEIKCSGGIPLWMTAVLSEQKIYKASYSKYGTAYQTMVYPYLQGGRKYA
ncbi:MAG: polyphosphate polymerase domain-containing protein [Eubacteriales bacterium]|nr:polyphosphate polymerase domain-containing protein [Eubacteriales bacterium]